LSAGPGATYGSNPPDIASETSFSLADGNRQKAFHTVFSTFRPYNHALHSLPLFTDSITFHICVAKEF